MKWVFLFFTACLLNTETIHAQQNYTLKRLTPDDGLSQGSNYGRLEDSEGFMWITALDALNRYDGNKVKVYNLDRYFKNCPRLTQAYGMVESPDKDIYIGSTRGLYRYHRQEDKFSLIRLYRDKKSKMTIPIGIVGQYLWCINEDWELASYDIRNGKILYKGKAPLAPNRISHIYSTLGLGILNKMPFIDKHGVIWFFHENQISHYQIRLDSFSTYTLSSNVKTITTIHYDSWKDQVFIGTEKGLLVIDVPQKQESFISQIEGQKMGHISSISTNKNHIALVTIDLKLVIADKKGWTNSKNLISNDQTHNARMYALMFDKLGRLWVCDDGLGQRIYDLNPAQIVPYPAENSEFKKLKEQGVSSFGETNDGKIIPQYFLYLNSKTNKMYHRKASEKECRYETDQFNQSILGYGSLIPEDRKSKIYVSELDSNLIEKNIKTNDYNLISQLQCLRSVAKNQYLVSSNNGLFWFDRKVFTPIENQPYKNSFQINILSRNRAAISYLQNDMQLVQYNADSKSIKFIQKLLPGIQSFYMQEDLRRNRYWVGTNEGIYLLDSQFKTVKSFSVNNGLAGSYIYGVLLDSQGNCWCSHQRGLSQIKAMDYHIINYDKSDGIQDWDFNNRAFHKAKDGRLYFGGVSGFNMIYPERNPIRYYSPKVYIDEVRVNNQFYNSNQSHHLLDELKLNNEENTVELNLSIRDLNFSSNSIIYRIKELDTNWQKIGIKEPLIFNKLARGDYSLELGYFDQFENKYHLQKTLRIIVPTPFYKATWFWVLFFLAVGGILLEYYNRLKLKKQQNLLQRQIAEDNQRQKITADLHDDLGASLSSLQVNSTIALNQLEKDPSKAKQILQKVVLQSQSITETMNDFIWSLRQNQDQFMTLSTRIKTYANDILEAKEIEFRFEYDNTIDILIKDATQKKNVVMIIREVINNAAKYSEASLVSLRIKIVQDIVYIEIEDDGKGFDLSVVERSGIRNIEYRIKELFGKMDLVTEQDKGTKLTIQFPLTP